MTIFQTVAQAAAQARPPHRRGSSCAGGAGEDRTAGAGETPRQDFHAETKRAEQRDREVAHGGIGRIASRLLHQAMSVRNQGDNEARPMRVRWQAGEAENSVRLRVIEESRNGEGANERHDDLGGGRRRFERVARAHHRTPQHGRETSALAESFVTDRALMKSNNAAEPRNSGRSRVDNRSRGRGSDEVVRSVPDAAQADHGVTR